MLRGDTSCLFSPPSLTPGGGGWTPRAILSFCVNLVSGEQLRRLYYMSYTHTHTHPCPQVSWDVSIQSVLSAVLSAVTLQQIKSIGLQVWDYISPKMKTQSVGACILLYVAGGTSRYCMNFFRSGPKFHNWRHNFLSVQRPHVMAPNHFANFTPFILWVVNIQETTVRWLYLLLSSVDLQFGKKKKRFWSVNVKNIILWVKISLLNLRIT